MAIELNVQTLMLELKDISQWEFFASHLNGIEQATIEEIKDTGLSTEEQKRKLCEEWLKVYPKASWEDVISALQPETDENRAAEHIKHGILKRNITSLDLENAAPKSDASSKHVKSTEPALSMKECFSLVDVPKTKKTTFKPKQFNRAAFEGDLGKLEEIYEQPENKYFILHRSIGSELPIQAACRSKSRDCKEVVQTLIKWEKEFRGTQEYEDFLEKQKIKPEDLRRNDSRLCEKPQNGDIALQTAFKFNNPGAIEALLAASDCDAELMRKQLIKGSGDLKNTVLHSAALENEEMMEIILKSLAAKQSVAQGGMPKDQPKLEPLDAIPNHNHDTPVHLAAQQGNLKILELMYKHNENCFSHCGRYNWTPLHTAVAYGKLEAVKTIVNKKPKHGHANKSQKTADMNPLLKPSVYMEDLQAFKVDKIDMDTYHSNADPDMTPLTLACMFGHTEIVEFLLKVGDTESIADYIKAKAFKEAFIRKHTECVKLLVIWSENAKALEEFFLTLYEELQEAKEETKEAVDHGKPEIPLKEPFFNALIQHMPDVAISVLDKCVMLEYCKKSALHDDHEYSNLESITMTYNLLIHPATTKNKSGCTHNNETEDNPLTVMANTNNTEFLKHPVVASFIFNRWNSAYGIFNMIYWFIYVICLVFTNVLLFTLPNPTSTHCENGTVNDTQDTTDEQPLPDTAYNAFAVILLITTLVRLLNEAILVITAIQQWERARNVLYYIDKIKRMDYLRDLANWILFLLTIVYSGIIFNANNKSFCLSAPEWQVGIALMCLSWIVMILESRDFQIIGVQAYTFWRVLKTIALFIPFALFMFAAFGFAFYLLLYQYTLKGSPFATEHYSFLSAYAMLAGDSSINDILGLDINAEARATPHPQYEVLTVIIWSISLLFMTIILTNIMTGLAVANISEIYKVADFQKLKLQVDHITARHRNLMGWMKFEQEKKYKPNEISLFHILRKSVVFGIWGGSPFDSESAVNRLHSRLIAWPEPNDNIECVSNKAEAGASTAAVPPMSQNLLEQVDESEHVSLPV